MMETYINISLSARTEHRQKHLFFTHHMTAAIISNSS